MDYYLIFGMVAVCMIAIYTAVRSIKQDVRKDVVSEQERRDKLQQTFTELNININNLANCINNMNEKDKVRDKRIEKHGEEIDQLDKQVQENKTKISLHEEKIKELEKRKV